MSEEDRIDTARRWLTGRADAGPEPVTLRAGPVTALLDGSDLRHVHMGGVELVQRVYVAVRDAPWNTIPAQYTDRVHDIGDDRFEIRFRARHRHPPIDFAWAGTITGTPDGVIRYEIDGICHGVFAYSKIGVNVHHDLPGSIGRPYRARQGDQTWTGRLPVAIDPQRIVDGTLSGMFEPYEELAIEVVDGFEAVVALEGDLLELQDHRNWADANFKSYATPLRLGFPFESTDGQRIRQVLTIRHAGQAPEITEGPASVRIGSDLGHRMPAIGLGMASDGVPLTPAESGLLRSLRPEHLRVDLRLRGDAWLTDLETALADAVAVGAPLELAAHVPPSAADALGRLAERLGRADVAMARVLVYPLADGFSAMASTTPPELVALVRDVLAPVIGPAVVAGGTDQSFADINRSRPTDPAIRGVCFSISPTVHAADDASIVENLLGLEEVVRFAREILAPRSIHVSPVTLATRFGPYPEGPPGPGALPPSVDPRQRSLLGAAWTAGSIGRLARAGATSATYYETAGWQGVLEREHASERPAAFPSRPGEVFPIYHVLADALEAPDAVVVDLQPSDPLVLDGFAVRRDDAVRVVVANLTPAPLSATIAGLAAGAVLLRTLDPSTVDRAVSDRASFRSAHERLPATADGELLVELGPYAVVTVDV